MTDWALEEAIKMAIGSGSDADGSFTFFHLDDVVEALRAAELRGRVAGMREAAEMVNSLRIPSLRETLEEMSDREYKGFKSGLATASLAAIKIISAAATKLESPNPTE